MAAHVPDVIPAMQSGMGKTSFMGSQTALLVKWCGHASVFPHVSKMQALTIFVVKKAYLILNFIHNIFDLRDTDIFICICII